MNHGKPSECGMNADKYIEILTDTVETSKDTMYEECQWEGLTRILKSWFLGQKKLERQSRVKVTMVTIQQNLQDCSGLVGDSWFCTCDSPIETKQNGDPVTVASH